MKKNFLALSVAAAVLAAVMLGGCGNSGAPAAGIQDGAAGTEISGAAEAGDGADTEASVAEAGDGTDTEASAAESGENMGAETKQREHGELADVSYSRVGVHDPSVVAADGQYYVFGSHMAWAKSPDLMHWKTFETNINQDYYELLEKEWTGYCKTDSNPELKGNLWAPDVIYNEAMQKWCMYMSVNGSDWNSVIVLLVADSIEGPYAYAGPVVWSGFNETSHPAERTDVYQVLGEGADLKRYQSTADTKINAIDPCVKYDEEGNLWMSYGSWFGGIFMLKLDPATGLRDYSVSYETVPNVSDAYYGYKIAGGHEVSGEASYLIFADGYYYLFLSYGGLTAQGGYQMRVFRSEAITGPYVDENGVSAVFEKNENNLFSEVGVRIMSSAKFADSFETRVAQGHNSVLADEDGKLYLVYHSRFAGGKGGVKEAHQVRVQQLFVNADGWLVAAPYEYAQETLPEKSLSMEDMAGEYQFILHEPAAYYRILGDMEIGIMETQHIVLQEDGTVSGDQTGTWTYEADSAAMSVTLEGVTYRGFFLKQPTEGTHEIVTVFTALGGNKCIWGSK